MTTRSAQKYQIEADWVLNEFCNYSCDYCFFHSKKEHELVGRISPDEYLNFFNKTGKTWLFHITGGEPLFYPNFAELCRTLSTSHYFALNSNLSIDEILRFANLVECDRVEYVHCGVHPQERERREGYQQLLARIQVLLDKGFAVFASCVMTPAIFERFVRIQNLFASVGVPLIPKSLRGTYQGRPYPESYTPEECEQLKAFAKIAEEIGRNSPWNPFRDPPTINPLMDQYFLDGFPDFTGVPCSTGMNFVRIKPDGSIYRCGRNSLIGNLLKRRLELYESSRPCDDTCCPYICLRYTRIDIIQAQKLPKRFPLPAERT